MLRSDYDPMQPFTLDQQHVLTFQNDDGCDRLMRWREEGGGGGW